MELTFAPWSASFLQHCLLLSQALLLLPGGPGELKLFSFLLWMKNSLINEGTVNVQICQRLSHLSVIFGLGYVPANANKKTEMEQQY